MNAIKEGFLNQGQTHQEEYMNPYNSQLGFPDVISIMCSQEQQEILMKALGPNLRTLTKQIPNNEFSKTTVYKITI